MCGQVSIERRQQRRTWGCLKLPQLLGSVCVGATLNGGHKVTTAAAVAVVVVVATATVAAAAA